MTRFYPSHAAFPADAGEEAIKVYVVVNTNRGPERITANLMGPLVMNLKKREVAQVVLHDARYSHQTPISGRE